MPTVYFPSKKWDRDEKDFENLHNKALEIEKMIAHLGEEVRSYKVKIDYVCLMLPMIRVSDNSHSLYKNPKEMK